MVSSLSRMGASLFGAALIGLGVGTAGAQTGTVIMSNDPSYCEIWGALSNVPSARCQAAAPGATREVLNRGLNIGNPQAAASRAAPTPDRPLAASFGGIQFEYDSFTLTRTAMTTLDLIAEVINDPAMRENRIIVEGHTDAAGSERYNQRLSERRAQSAVQYLMLRHHVDARRITWGGRGESELVDPRHPYAAENRRVVFLNIGN